MLAYPANPVSKTRFPVGVGKARWARLCLNLQLLQSFVGTKIERLRSYEIKSQIFLTRKGIRPLILFEFIAHKPIRFAIQIYFVIFETDCLNGVVLLPYKVTLLCDWSGQEHGILSSEANNDLVLFV